MNINQGYATAAGGIVIIFVLANFLPRITRLAKHISLLISKHLTYLYLLHRHRFLGPWSRADVLVQLIYIAANIICLIFKVSTMPKSDLPTFQVSTISESGLQAGTLSLINMIPVFAGPHLGFLADLLGLSMSTYRHLHRSAGIMSCGLALFHVLVAVASQPSFGLDLPQNLFAVIVSVRSPCHILKLTLHREDRHLGFYCCCLLQFSAGSRTKYFSVYIKHWRYSLGTLFGVIYLLMGPSLAFTYILVLHCSYLCSSSNAASFCTGMASFAMGTPKHL
jgi:hypothetical protein